MNIGPGIGKIRQQMLEKGISFKKKYGQNFLSNGDILSRISESVSGSPECGILEIGAGAGTLTAYLADSYKKVAAVEIDSDLIPLLEENLADFDNVSIICEDIMKTDPRALVDEHLSECDEIAVCANLPYYITTPIIMLLLESGIDFSSITVMIQKEVADRLTALPGTADYGAITASCAYYGKAKKLFSVPAGNFTPPPKVDSAVVRIKLYGDDKPVRPADEKTMFSVISAAFAQRRKTLSNALSAAMPDVGKENVSFLLESIGIDPSVRGETLSVSQFSEIADAVYAFRKNK